MTNDDGGPQARFEQPHSAIASTEWTTKVQTSQRTAMPYDSPAWSTWEV